MQNEPLSSIAAAKEDQPTINHLSSIALATEDQPLVLPKSDEAGSESALTLNQPHATSDFGIRTSDFKLAPAANLQLSTINHQLPPEVIDAKPLPATVQPH